MANPHVPNSPEWWTYHTQEVNAANAANAQAADLRQRELERIDKQDLLEESVLLPQLGIEPVYNDAGKLVSYNVVEDATTDLKAEVERIALEQSRKALLGELPVNEELSASLDLDDQIRQNIIARQFGDRSGSSSAAIEKEARGVQSRRNVEEASRTGKLSQFEQIALARGRQNATDFSGLFNPGGQSTRFQTAANSIKQGFTAQQPQQRQSILSQILGGVAGVAGSAIGGGITSQVAGRYDDPVSIWKAMGNIFGA
tara:strand:+ start:5058 stop:5828 length:771 start_codon:yes stop_codon:yes gene_type:complete